MTCALGRARSWTGPRDLGRGPFFIRLLVGAVFNVGRLSSFRALVLLSHARLVVPDHIWSPRLDLETQARLGDPCKYDVLAGPGPVLDQVQGPGPGPFFNNTSCGGCVQCWVLAFFSGACLVVPR